MNLWSRKPSSKWPSVLLRCHSCLNTGQLGCGKIKKHLIHHYSEDSLKRTWAAIRNDSVFIKNASRKFEIPRATLQDRLWWIIEGPRKMGPPTALSTEEENQLVQWLLQLTKYGFPQKKRFLKRLWNQCYKIKAHCVLFQK